MEPVAKSRVGVIIVSVRLAILMRARMFVGIRLGGGISRKIKSITLWESCLLNKRGSQMNEDSLNASQRD